MTNAMHKRMKHGIRWSDHRAPAPTAKEIATTVFSALLIVLAYLFASYRDAQSGMVEAQAKQAKAEVTLVELLNGNPLVNDDGMVILARIETAGGE